MQVVNKQVGGAIESVCGEATVSVDDAGGEGQLV